MQTARALGVSLCSVVSLVTVLLCFNDLSAPAMSSAQDAMHEVRPGDDLKLLAEYYYGDPQLWERIWHANRDKIRNPNRLERGALLLIPDATPPAESYADFVARVRGPRAPVEAAPTPAAPAAKPAKAPIPRATDAPPPPNPTKAPIPRATGAPPPPAAEPAAPPRTQRWVGGILFFVGWIVLVIGGVWFLINTFRVSILWGFLCLIPGVAIAILFLFWKDVKKPFYWELAGMAICLVGFLLAWHGI